MEGEEKKSIEIDLEVHQAIELKRISFSESQNDILRRILELEQWKDSIARSRSESIFSQASRRNPGFNLPPMPAVPPPDVVGFLGETETELSLSEKIKRFHSQVSGALFSPKPAAARDWQFSGVRLPEGTRLQKWYGGKKYEAEIRDGAIWFDGTPYQSPSAAAMVISGGSNVSGWNFWKYFDPADGEWKKLSSLKSGAQEGNEELTKI